MVGGEIGRMEKKKRREKSGENILVGVWFEGREENNLVGPRYFPPRSLLI